MSDKKNDIDTDFEEKLAEIVGKNSRNRTNNIYERFINRVDNSDEDYDESHETGGGQQADNAQNLSTHVPLDTYERSLLDTQKEDREVALEFTDVIFDFSDLDKEASVSERVNANKSFRDSDLDNDSFGFDFVSDDINDSRQAPEPTVLPDNEETVPLPDGRETDSRLVHQDLPTQPADQKEAPSPDKLANSKKPLIIGMILGSLLIGVVVAILIFTGILSPSPQSNVSNSANANMSSEVEAQAATESVANVSTTPAPTAVDNVPLADTSPSNPSAVTSQQASPVNKSQVATSDDTAEPTTATLDTTSNTEPAITYEDFREESQITVYRETND
ncbi:hypothetical protein ACT3TH_11915 [Psychrobacter sp. AOP22-C1-C5]|uniref:hypothetical protein n=1 Tax=Psychrobacter sp. AOP22-C1-C5 TaxID=3457716 RepID=UPI004036124F